PCKKSPFESGTTPTRSACLHRWSLLSSECKHGDLLPQLPNGTEADIMVAVRRREPGTKGGPAIPGFAGIAAAPHCPSNGGVFLSDSTRVVKLSFVQLLTPLGQVPVHVVDPKSIRLLLPDDVKLAAVRSIPTHFV